MTTLICIIALVSVVVLLLIFPFRARFQGHIDVFANVCIYSIKIIFLQVIVGRCKLSLVDGLDIENQINNLNPDKAHPHIQQMYISGLIKRMKISKFDFYFIFGISSDAFTTAMVCGTAQTLSACAISYVLNSNKTAQVLSSITPVYDKNECEMSLQVSLQVSVFDLWCAKMRAKKLYKKLYLRG